MDSVITQAKRRATIEIVVLFLTGAVITILLVLGVKGQVLHPRRTRRPSHGQEQFGPRIYSEADHTEKPHSPGFHRCPLCGTVLEKKEKVKSVLYPGKPDGMMEIFGCPYCYSASHANSGLKGRNKPRICPVCKQTLPAGGMLYARFFQSSERRHAHVLGCSHCYTRRRY
ncbi:MAG TPA: hypothetical protein VJ967_10515 [Clostridia bacterium]|nr:hypothetical protein [Clostridia bacterium]